VRPAPAGKVGNVRNNALHYVERLIRLAPTPRAFQLTWKPHASDLPPSEQYRLAMLAGLARSSPDNEGFQPPIHEN
jgi:hypothetical protein